MSGYFIVFEGGEGAGKSTQEALLAEALTSEGRSVVRTREPGGTPAGEAIRNVLLSNEYAGWSDRYLDSSVAYQGYGRELGADRVRDLSVWATEGLLPDLTILLDVDPTVGLSRVESPDRLESEPIDYHQQVRAAFLDIATQEPGRFLVVDASGSVEEIATIIRGRVADLLGGSA
jgi:dTMP kinase